MTLLSPWSALIAAAVAIPLLLLLYVLKLRRRPQRIASTLLWRAAHEDLQVNAPFQRLRWSSLLALQLLAMALILLAFAEPFTEGDAAPPQQMIIVIDHSASMNTTLPGEDQAAAVDGAPARTRLDLARERARQTIDRLGRSDQPVQCMIIAYAASTRVMSSFQSDRAMLHAAIDAIEPTDEPADLQQALQVAGAFALQTDESDDAPLTPPRIVLLSDGCVGQAEEAGGFQLRSGQLQFIAIGADPDAVDAATTSSDLASTSNNLGITAFAAERDFEDPVRVRLFVRLANASPQSIRTVLTIAPLPDLPAASAPDRVSGFEQIAMPPADAASSIVRSVTVPPADDTGPGQLALTLELIMPGGGVLLARHAHRDSLAADNTAALVLAPANPPRIALVHPAGQSPDPFLIDLGNSIDTDVFDRLTAPQFDALDRARLDGGELYDFIIFDRAGPTRLPGVPTLTIGAVPASITTIEPRDQRGQRAATWDRQHPVMRYVELEGLIFAGFGGFELPPAGQALATAALGPIIAQVRSRGARHVMVGFELERSNWPIDVSFTVFFLNVLDQALLGRSGRQGMTMQPGSITTIRPLPGTSDIRIVGPVLQTVRIPEGEAGRSISLPRLARSGLYAVEGADVPLGTLAVSLLSEQETDNRVRQTLRINAEQQQAQLASDAAPRPLWQWLIVAAMIVLILEWTLWSLKRGALSSAPRRPGIGPG